MYLRLQYSGKLALLAMAVVLSGCANNDYDTSAWFAKPIDLFGRNNGYSYSQLGEVKNARPLTANALVDANGACPGPVTPAQPQFPPINPGAGPAATPGVPMLAGGGIGIGASECDVVSRIGQPNAVNLGRTPSGDRTAVLTFRSGPQPGVYRFVGGRLTEMDRLDEPSPPPPKAAKRTRKKPARASARRVSTE